MSPPTTKCACGQFFTDEDRFPWVDNDALVHRPSSCTKRAIDLIRELQTDLAAARETIGERERESKNNLEAAEEMTVQAKKLSDDLAAAGRAAAAACDELARARTLHDPMRSAHEGYAVLLEEVEELWDEIKTHDRDAAALRKEAVQVAAMALRFIEDVCDSKEDHPCRCGHPHLSGMDGEDGGCSTCRCGTWREPTNAG